MARRKDHSREELKELILASSVQIIVDEGIQSLTARRIATHIGYAPGTIYNVFPSMEDLLLHVNARTLDSLKNVLEHSSCHHPRKSALQNMKAMALRYMGFANDFRPLWMALFSYPVDNSRPEYEWYRDKVDSLFMPLQAMLHKLLPDLSSRDCQIHARILWSSVHGLIYLNATEKFPTSDATQNTRKLLACLVDTYTSGLIKAQ